MAKLKLTKTELKAQSDALKQYKRFLPTLQLKKQQLQLEMRKAQAALDVNRAEYARLRTSLERFTALYAAPGAEEFFASHLHVEKVVSTPENIAGVTVPTFERVDFRVDAYDLYLEDFWIDEGMRTLEELISLRAAGDILAEQHRLLGNELLSTTQRVNLFEKVKIPECEENIRKIRIAMGDESTAAVVRSKIAKRKMQEAAA